jgi:ribonuclease-3
VAEDARDPKSALQEWVQARGLPLPDYVETGREGPDHAPRFTVDVRLSTGQTAQAQAKSKRLAEQEAAKALLGLLEDGDG